VLDCGGHGGYRIGISRYMQASHELVTPAEGASDPVPADFQRALATKPRRINPATCALGDHCCALCDHIPRRDGQYTTQTRSGVRRTDQRRLQRQAMGLIIDEVFCTVKSPPIRLTGRRRGGFI
jgi:hypothetical protein